LEDAVSDAPQVKTARLSERIAELEARKAKGALLPTVQGTASYIIAGNTRFSYLGLSVVAPVTAGAFFQAGSASAQANRASEDRRKIEDQTRVSIGRLRALVIGGQQALEASARAVEAAELSITANKKSYEGGVRTNLDVVNAIQTSFEVKSQFVTSSLQVGDNLINLYLLTGMDPAKAMEQVQRFLFGVQE
jgi:protease secretion system outer membrane protein